MMMPGAVTFALLAALSGPESDTIRYELVLARDDSSRRVIDVRVQFRGGARGRTLVQLPHAWAGHTDLERSVTRLAVAAPTRARLARGDSGHRRIVTHPPGATVDLRYRLRQDWAGAIRRPQYFRALIREDLAVLVGQNSLVHPVLRDEHRIVVHFTWKGIPKGWVVAGSYGEGHTQQSRTTINALLESVTVLGPFRSYAAPALGSPIRVLVGGTWSFADSSLVRAAREIAARQRDFWHDSTAAPYVVASVPSEGGLGGTAFTRALVMYADSASRLPAFAGLLSHEMFHAWNGHAMRTAGPEGGMKWFSEGFTDFFADRFSRDAGFVSSDAYLQRANDALRHYYLSPVRHSTRADVNRLYWTDPDVNRFPYYQGYLIAGFLDAQLRSATGNGFTIDSLLLAVYRRASASGRLVDDSTVVAAAPRTVRDAVRDSLRSFIVRGNLVPVASSGFGPCLKVRAEEMYPFDLGFDMPRSIRDRVVRGVRPGAPADSAGLRDGMQLRGWSWFNGDAAKPASVRITDGDTTRTITWFPRGPRTLSVPQLAALTECAGRGGPRL